MTNSKMNSNTELMEKVNAAMTVTQGETPLMRPIEIFSRTAISMGASLKLCIA
jgi:hypothetical protein